VLKLPSIKLSVANGCYWPNGGLVSQSTRCNALTVVHRCEVLWRLDGHHFQSEWDMSRHQLVESIYVLKIRVELSIKVFRLEHQGDAFGVDMLKTRVGRQGDHGKGDNTLVPKLPFLIKVGER